jgi:hypothetical protein
MNLMVAELSCSRARDSRFCRRRDLLELLDRSGQALLVKFTSSEKVDEFVRLFEAKSSGVLFVPSALREEVEVEQVLEQASSVSSTFSLLQRTSAYSRGNLKTVIEVLLCESFALPSRSGLLGEVLRLIIAEHPEVRTFLPRDASCAGHRLLLKSLSDESPPVASVLLLSLVNDDVGALASNVFFEGCRGL